MITSTESTLRGAWKAFDFFGSGCKCGKAKPRIAGLAHRLNCELFRLELTGTSPESLRCDPASGGFITQSSNVTQSLKRIAILSATAKSTIKDTDEIEGDSAGDHMTYRIDLNNTGTTTLSAISVSSAILEYQKERYVSRVGRRRKIESTQATNCPRQRGSKRLLLHLVYLLLSCLTRGCPNPAALE